MTIRFKYTTTVNMPCSVHAEMTIVQLYPIDRHRRDTWNTHIYSIITNCRDRHACSTDDLCREPGKPYLSYRYTVLRDGHA